MRFLITTLSLLLGLLFTTGIASAQHHHHGHRGHGHVPVHHGTHYGHHNWHHVVPHNHHHSGAYYTVGNTHYYTPSHVTSIIQTNPTAPPPVIVEAQKPVELTFGGLNRFEDLAGRLSFEANALCLDMHYNYRHNKNFTEVYREAYAVLQTARYLHGKEHQGDREAIRRRMVSLDKDFHHLQEEMRGWSRLENKQIESTSFLTKIESAEAVIHHLCFDVGVKPHEQQTETAPPPGGTNEVAPPPGK